MGSGFFKGSDKGPVVIKGDPENSRLIQAVGLPVSWRVTMEAPPRLELVLRQKEGKLLVNLINRGAGEALSPTRVMTDEVLPVENVIVRVRQDQRPRSVSVVPSGMNIDWNYADGQVTVKVPRVEIHRVLVID